MPFCVYFIDIDPVKDKIAVVGFSAGGHLSACAATMAKHKPAAAILIYSAILSDILDLCKPNLPLIPTSL